jgi:hypothetical protein
VIDGLHPALLRARLDRDGGFTVEVPTGAPLERGIAVSVHPSHTWRFRRADWHDDAVSRWIQCHARRDGTRTIGGWLDGGQVWLDCVRVLPAALRPVVVALGHRHGQLGVYDLRRRRLVRLRSIA